ncbi:MFS transporter [Sphingomonas sp.]|uniref:MFS transporter n=1 Tax=Sphingomonas sp. TaxID=28214 RepID=UPI0025D04671|nr:MFS transporter [Sphingomonas sp.]
MDRDRIKTIAGIASISFGTALVILDGGIANVALPTIARDLGVDSSAAVLIITVYQLILVMTLLPLSAIGDRIGLRRLYQYGQILFAAASLLAFFANTLPFLLVVRAFQALGAAAVLSVTSAMLRTLYSPEKLGRGLGFNSVVVSSAGALAPTAGGFLLSFANWPWLFAAAVPFALASLALGAFLPNPPPRNEPYDFAGALLCAATFGLLIGGLESAVHGSSPLVSAFVTAIGVGLAVVLVRNQKREPRPVLPVDLLARPVLALSAIGGFTVFIASMTLLVSLPFRLEHSYGFTPSQVGAMMAPWPLTTLFVAPLAGTLSDRYPAGLLGGIGMGVGIVALLLIAFMPAAPTYFDVAWRMSLCGAGFGMFMSPNARLIIGSAPSERAAAAGGLISTIRLCGQTMGATLVAALLALGLGGGSIPALIACGLALVAGLCSVARLNPGIRSLDTREVDAVRPVGPLN